MPEFQFTDSILTSLNAQEPWPDNVKLFQPYEVEQILLPDNASCLAVQAFLKMCNLPFEVEMRWNAEFMSPSSRVPFIKCGAFVVSELEPIVQFAANKGVTLCEDLSAEEKAEMRAYMSLITNVLVNAELYISWLDEATYCAVTRVRNSSVYPWPLGWLQTRSKRGAVAKRLRALHWADKTLDQVLADVEQCCNSLSQRLGERDYFFGTTPTPLDALLYGHLRALLSANGPKAALFIKPMTTTLLKHVVRMASASGMKLTPQEDYLLAQAFQFTRTKLSPECTAFDRTTRIKRSRLCIRNGSGENLTYNKTASRDNMSFNKEIIAFKPFASKQVIVATNKHGGITCKYKDSNNYSTTTFRIEDKDIYGAIVEFIDDILDKVEEVAFAHLNTEYDDKHDFEIVYPHEETFANVSVNINEYLDTIEEVDATDTSLDMQEDLALDKNDDNEDSDDNNLTDIDIVNEEKDDIQNTVTSDAVGVDSDGMINDKHLEEVKSSESCKDTFIVYSDVDSSNNKAMKDEYLTLSSSRFSKESEKSETDPDPVSTDSQSTLKLPSDEEMSVESLLKCMREKSALYGNNFGNYLLLSDVD